MTNRYQGVDPVLTDLSLAYQNEAYVAEEMFKPLPVKLQSGKHFVYDKGNFRSNDLKRGPGARSKEVTHNISTGLAYVCEDHAAKEFVPDEDVDNAADGVDPYADATDTVTEMLKISREVEAAAALTATATMTQNTTGSGTSLWNDSNSDPIAAIRTAAQTIHSSVMKNPNTLLLGKQVFDKLVDHPAIVERVKYSQLGVLSTDLLARLFNVERILVGAAEKNTSVEGQADTMGYIWGKNAVLAYVNPRLGQKTVTLGVAYKWKDRQVERLNGTDERDRRGQFIRAGDEYYDQEFVTVLAGYLFKDIVA